MYWSNPLLSSRFPLWRYGWVLLLFYLLQRWLPYSLRWSTCYDKRGDIIVAVTKLQCITHVSPHLIKRHQSVRQCKRRDQLWEIKHNIEWIGSSVCNRRNLCSLEWAQSYLWILLEFTGRIRDWIIFEWNWRKCTNGCNVRWYIILIVHTDKKHQGATLNG